MATAEPLHMIRLRLLADRLVDLGRRRHLPLGEVDSGYLVHCQLRELFGEAAPGPFAVTDGRGRFVTVLGYAAADEAALRERAEAFADPAIYAAVDWSTFSGKAMPATWAAGRRLGFEVRACPVVRMASAGPRHRKGAEVDAFLARCFRVDPTEKVDREAVYRDWLAAQLARQGGARVTSARVTAFKRERLSRPTHRSGERASVVERPDATLGGELEVADPALFAALLRRGIGRHRAFGFGMLLLRPPGGP